MHLSRLWRGRACHSLCQVRCPWCSAVGCGDAPQAPCITQSRPNSAPPYTKATWQHAPLLRSSTIAAKKPILGMGRRRSARRITYFDKLWMQQVVMCFIQGAVGACQGDDREHQKACL